MPADVENPFPHVSKAEWDQARQGVPRHIQAARLLMVRKVPGIPSRTFLMGDSDHAPILQGLAEFTDAVYNLLDGLDDHPSLTSSTETGVEIVRNMMETLNGTRT